MDTHDADSIIAPYAQLEEEPYQWYEKFAKYYLLLGPSRSIRKAWLTWLAIEYPEQLTQKEMRPSAPKGWSDNSRKWEWRKRADLYDAEMYKESLQVVEGARVKLLGAAEEAANTLIMALTSSRLKVAAAKEILDRAGLPFESS